MKKIILFAIAILFISCEDDDFCTQNPVTPKLVLKFMNNLERSKTKQISTLNVWANSKKDSLPENTAVDSILIPLNSNVNKTVYNFAKSKDSISQLQFEYKVSYEFVSKACGYKCVFSDIKITENIQKKSWIKELSTKKITSLKSQKNAHVIVYH